MTMAAASCLATVSARAQSAAESVKSLHLLPAAAPVAAKSARDTLLMQVRTNPLVSPFFGHSLDPSEHAFSHVKLCFSVGRRRGFGLFVNAEY